MSRLTPAWEWFARRPAAPAALAAIAGILLHRTMPVCPGAWVGLAGAGAALAVALRRREHLACAALAVAIVLTFCAAAQLRAFAFAPDHIVHFTDQRPRLARVRVEIITPPDAVTAGPAATRPLPARQLFDARVLAVQTRAGWADASGIVRFSIDRVHPQLRVGQTVEALGLLTRPPGPMNPGQFDFAAHGRYRRLLANLRVDSPENLRILAQPGPTPLWSLRAFVRDRLARGFTPAQGVDHALLAALLLGDSDPQLRPVYDRFVATGTSHHLAISGMHVAVLGGLVYGLCRLLRLSPRRGACIVLGFVVLYGSVTLPSPPVVRSVLLCVAFGVGLIRRRAADAVQLLALTVVAMLLYNPLDLYGAGFQLSFGCVLGLILLSKPIRGLMVRAPLDHPTPRRRPWLRRAGNALYRGGTEALAAGVAAWLVSLPLVALHFERLNPWAIVGSLVLAVPVFAALVGGLLKLLLTILIPWGAGLWAPGAAAPIATMRATVDALALLPGSDVPFPVPPLAVVLTFYALLLAIRFPVPAIRRWMRWNPAALTAFVLTLPLLLGASRSPDRALRMTLLSVGAGSCAVVELPDGRALMVDAGSATLSDPYRSVIGPFLRHRRIGRIDALYLSHANADHYSAVADLLEAMPVGRIAVPPDFVQTCQRAPSGRRLLETIGRHNVPMTVTVRGERFAYPPAALDVLWPAPHTQLSVNDASLVLKLSCRGRSILLTGDIQHSAQANLLDAAATISADILVAPHHGSAEPTTADFLAAVGPKLILCSNDRTLSGKQRVFDALPALPPTYRTHRYGALTAIVDADGNVRLERFVQAPDPTHP